MAAAAGEAADGPDGAGRASRKVWQLWEDKLLAQRCHMNHTLRVKRVRARVRTFTFLTRGPRRRGTSQVWIPRGRSLQSTC